MHFLIETQDGTAALKLLKELDVIVIKLHPGSNTSDWLKKHDDSPEIVKMTKH